MIFTTNYHITIKRGENTIITNDIAKNNFEDFSNKDTKLSSEVRNGKLFNKLFKIINELYETNQNTPGYLLAGSIYGPSYISFEYALSYYGLIPERVSTITCTTMGKKKKKQYDTDFGNFTYRDVPDSAYQEEILLITEDDYSYQIATPEKTLCDKLYTLAPLNNYSVLKNMLFNDLRINGEVFCSLDFSKIEKLSVLYHSTNVNLLAKYMRRNINE